MEVYVWVRVEDRSGTEGAGSILASVGPEAYAPDSQFSVALREVPNGSNRVVVLEVRESDNPGMPVLYYGLSEPFDIVPGTTSEAKVFLQLQQPLVEQHDTSIQLTFDGEPADTVGPALLGSATIVTRSAHTVTVVLANDPSFSANLTTLPVDSPGPLCECVTEEIEGVPWTDCSIGPWPMTKDLPETVFGDGLYSVYVKFVDTFGYESQVYKASVVLDSLAPVPLAASLSPTAAHLGQTVLVSVSVHEPLAETSSVLSAIPKSDGELHFAGPVRVGDSNTYLGLP